LTVWSALKPPPSSRVPVGQTEVAVSASPAIEEGVEDASCRATCTDPIGSEVHNAREVTVSAALVMPAEP